MHGPIESGSTCASYACSSDRKGYRLVEVGADRHGLGAHTPTALSSRSSVVALDAGAPQGGIRHLWLHSGALPLDVDLPYLRGGVRGRLFGRDRLGGLHRAGGSQTRTTSGHLRRCVLRYAEIHGPTLRR